MESISNATISSIELHSHSLNILDADSTPDRIDSIISNDYATTQFPVKCNTLSQRYKAALVRHKKEIENFNTIYFEQEEENRIMSKPNIVIPPVDPRYPERYFLIIYLCKEMDETDDGQQVFKQFRMKCATTDNIENFMIDIRETRGYNSAKILAIHRTITMIQPKRQLRRLLTLKNLRIPSRRCRDEFVTKPTFNIDQILCEFNNIALNNTPMTRGAETVHRLIIENRRCEHKIQFLENVVTSLIKFNDMSTDVDLTLNEPDLEVPLSDEDTNDETSESESSDNSIAENDN